MNDELKYAKMIVKFLRCHQSKEENQCLSCSIAQQQFCNDRHDDEIADLIDSLIAQLAESQCREKAAVEDIWNASANAPCAVCAHGFANTGKPCPMRPCKFEWRGPQETEEDTK